MSKFFIPTLQALAFFGSIIASSDAQARCQPELGGSNCLEPVPQGGTLSIILTYTPIPAAAVFNGEATFTSAPAGTSTSFQSLNVPFTQISPGSPQATSTFFNLAPGEYVMVTGFTGNGAPGTNNILCFVPVNNSSESLTVNITGNLNQAIIPTSGVQGANCQKSFIP